MTWTTGWYQCHLLRWRSPSGRTARAGVGPADVSGKSLELSGEVRLETPLGAWMVFGAKHLGKIPVAGWGQNLETPPLRDQTKTMEPAKETKKGQPGR